MTLKRRPSAKSGVAPGPDDESARLAAIVAGSNEAIIGYQQDGIIDSWNAGAEQVLGYPASEVVGRSIGLLLAPDRQDEMQQLLDACAHPDAGAKIETCWVRKDGEQIWIELSCSPVKDETGQVVSGSAIARDISKRRRAEQALARSEQRLAAILDQTMMGLAQTDLEGNFELVNPQFCEIVGRPAECLYGMNVRDIVHPDDYQENLAMVSALVAERARFQLDVRFIRADGSIVWTSNNVSDMHDGESPRRHLIAAVLDITQQKRASQHVVLMLDELNHRVKNTLATVQAIAQQTLAGATSLQAFGAAFNARLMALSKTHNLLANDAWTGIHLRDAVRSELAPYLHREQGGSRVAIEGDDLLLTPKHALALSMALHELATNAAKYGALSGDTGQVRVRWEAYRENGQAWLRLLWSEHGGPSVATPARRGFGTRLITEGLAFELEGRADLDYAATGVQCVIEVPLPETAP